MNLKGFLDGLAQEKYLVYFMLAWAGTLFFWGILGVYSRATNLTDAYNGIMLLSRLCDVGSGIMLALLALKMLIPNFMPTLKREQTLIYFLLLWAGGFFIYSIADFAWYAQHGFGGLPDFVDILGTLSSLAAGAVLGLFAWKLLQSKASIVEPVTQTV